MITKIKAFFKRDFIISASYKISFVLDIIVVFFQLLFWYYISLFLTKNIPLEGLNYSYFEFLIIGIAFHSFLAFFLTNLSSQIRESQVTGTLQSVLSTPISPLTFFIGTSAFGFLKTALRLFFIILFGVILFNLNLSNINFLSLIVIFFIGIISFFSIGLIISCFTLVFKQDISGWTDFFLRIFNIIYYPIILFPVFIRPLLYLLPTTHYLKGIRLAIFENASISSLGTNILVLSVFAVILLPFSLWLFNYSLKVVKKKGTLVEF